MRTFLKIFIPLVIVVVLGMYARSLWWDYKLAYSNGVLDGLCYTTMKLDIPDNGNCEGRFIHIGK